MVDQKLLDLYNHIVSRTCRYIGLRVVPEIKVKVRDRIWRGTSQRVRGDAVKIRMGVLWSQRISVMGHVWRVLYDRG